MTRLPRPCLGCGALVRGASRCPPCAATADTTRRDYGSAERQRRARAVAAWTERCGDWCPGWGHRAAHPVAAPNVLTADHEIPVAAGGDQSGVLVVLCQSCNSSKGART